MADGWQTEPTPDLKQLTVRAVAARAEVARAFPRQERNMRIAGKESPSGSQLRSSRLRWRVGRASLSALCIGVLALLVIVPGAQAAPGTWTQAQVNQSIVNAVAWIDAPPQRNANGSYGSSYPVAETGMALVAYSVLANGNFSSLPGPYQDHIRAAIIWLKSQQSTTDGSWDYSGYKTYETGIALGGLSSFVGISFTGVNPNVPAMIANGRNFLINKDWQGPPHTVCSSTTLPQASYCGGWDYEDDIGRSDESNTGYAMFGLQLTGGIPASIAVDNINWQNHIQEFLPNPLFPGGRNDGGGDYQPGIHSGLFSSNANDTGTMLFGLGYDKVMGNDPHVVAGLLFGQDILNVYEAEQPTDNQIYHGGAVEDGSCVIGPSCDWYFSGGEGGFHYSLFSLSKGLGEYIPPVLTDSNNWYAKVVDLLLSQQRTNGSWPMDGRDDASDLIASAFSVGSLGLVGVPGYVEICKASDPAHPVTGTFTFTATNAGFSSGPISVPVGQCSGSIQVPSGGVTVTETPKIGVAVSNVTAIAYDELGFQHNELLAWTQPDLHALVNVMAGDQDEETLTTFTNYAAPPGQLKLCKIAGDQFTLGQVFTFTVTSGQTRDVYMITAGPPSQGGYCVLGRSFPVNTPVKIVETPKFPFRPSRITVNEGQLMACQPPSIYCTVASVIPGITEVTFTNVLRFGN